MLMKFKGIFIVFTFLLSFIACNYVNAEPAPPVTPEQHVLNHIMSAGNCNEHEAYMILAIMANRSVNHDGLDFYARYLMGNDTEAQKQFNSVRGHDYYVFWEGFLKEWSKKSIEEKADALHIDTPSDEKTNEILSKMDGDEAALIIDRLTPVLDQANKTIDELNNLNEVSFSKANRLKDEMNNISPDINNAVELAHIEYSMVDHPAPFYDGVFGYKTDALDIYNNPNLTNYDKVVGLTNLNNSYKHNLDALKSNVQNLNETGFKLKDKGLDLTVMTPVVILAGLLVIVFGLVALFIGQTTIAIILFILGALATIAGIILIPIARSMDSTGTKIKDAANTLNKYKIQNEESYYSSVDYIDGLVASLY